ncbi:Adhesin, conjugal transfer protein PilV (plasmid) [Pararobbsia alpina]
MFLSEQALSLIVGAIALTYAVQNNNDAIDAVTAQATGQYMATLQQAENTYIFDNFTALSTSDNTAATLSAGPPGNIVSANIEQPLKPTVADLKALKLLPIGFNEITPLKLTFATTLTPVNCPSTDCVINGIIYSTQPYRDTSGRVREDVLTQAVAIAGADAGMSYAESPNLIVGLGNEWNEPNPVAPASAGVLAMHVGASSYLGNVVDGLYPRNGSRDLTGDMPANNQSIGNAKNMQANGTVQGGQVSSLGNMNAAGNVAAGGNLTGAALAVTGSANINGEMQSGSVFTGQVVATAAVSGQTVTSAGSVNTAVGGGYATAGASCAGERLGAIRSDNTGKSLSCQNDGLWHPASGDGGAAVGSSYMPSSGVTQYFGICTSVGGWSYSYVLAGWEITPYYMPYNNNDPSSPVCPSNLPYFYVLNWVTQDTGGG